MNDRYLFKAKRTDNGEWVQGHLFDDGFENGRTFIGGLAVGKCNGNACDNQNISSTDSYEIDPSTLCQCTGLKDKNGKLIWENDIVKFDVYDYEKLKSSIISVVKWCNEVQSLTIVINRRNNRGTLGHILESNKEIEVIGNIFDNPELLEECDND